MCSSTSSLGLDPAGLVLKAGNDLIPFHQVKNVALSRVEEQIVTIERHDGRMFEAHGFDAIEIVMQLKASALEGRRLKWKPGAWALHNIAGHLGLQLLVWLGYKKAGIRWHDYTTPRPR